MTMEDAKTLAAKFDHNSTEQMNCPYPMYEALRAKCPVGHAETYGGFYVVSRYDLVKKVFEDYSTFSSQQGVAIPDHPYRMLPIDLDPPLQTKFRRNLNRRFTPEAVAAKRDDIDETINALIDAFIEKGEADLASQLVRPLLPAIVLPYLGVPRESQQQMTEWIDLMTRGRSTDIEGVARAGEAIGAYLMGLIAQRRQQAPVDDVIGMLLEAGVDGSRFTDEEIFRQVLIILFGGLDTTSAVMLETLLYLARHPEQRSKLAAGEVAWAPAIEEFVRYSSPIQGLRRTVTTDVELDGVSLKKGDRVLGLHGSANRDERAFTNPNEVVLDRAPNQHVGFGTGAHICLGRNLARLEIEILLKTVFERLGDYRVEEAFEPEYLVGEARGMKSLPVRFTAGAVRAAKPQSEAA